MARSLTGPELSQRMPSVSRAVFGKLQLGVTHIFFAL